MLLWLPRQIINLQQIKMAQEVNSIMQWFNGKAQFMSLSKIKRDLGIIDYSGQIKSLQNQITALNNTVITVVYGFKPITVVSGVVDGVNKVFVLQYKPSMVINSNPLVEGVGYTLSGTGLTTVTFALAPFGGAGQVADIPLYYGNY